MSPYSCESVFVKVGDSETKEGPGIKDTAGKSLESRGVKLTFAGGHISLTVAFKGPNVI